MESGGKVPYKVKTGWLGRGMKVAGLKQEGLALALPMPLILRGVPQNNNYFPTKGKLPTDKVLSLLKDVYKERSEDELIGMLEIIKSRPKERSYAADDLYSLANEAGTLLKKPDGPRVAVFEVGGFDTHAAQGGVHGTHSDCLKEMDLVFGTLKKRLKEDEIDFNKLRSLGATGSPLSQEVYNWIYQKVKSDIWLAPLSGGTDFAGAFVIGNPLLDVKEGEMQSKSLGCAVYAFDDNGNSVVGEVGQLVCTKPLPSMPLYFWGDKQNRRLTESYFETFPGVWKHGDWIEFTDYGGSVIYGRSDATINRRGLRLGSSEIYTS